MTPTPSRTILALFSWRLVNLDRINARLFQITSCEIARAALWVLPGPRFLPATPVLRAESAPHTVVNASRHDSCIYR